MSQTVTQVTEATKQALKDEAAAIRCEEGRSTTDGHQWEPSDIGSNYSSEYIFATSLVKATDGTGPWLEMEGENPHSEEFCQQALSIMKDRFKRLR